MGLDNDCVGSRPNGIPLTFVLRSRTLEPTRTSWTLLRIAHFVPLQYTASSPRAEGSQSELQHVLEHLGTQAPKCTNVGARNPTATHSAMTLSDTPRNFASTTSLMLAVHMVSLVPVPTRFALAHARCTTELAAPYTFRSYVQVIAASGALVPWSCVSMEDSTTTSSRDPKTTS